jgi:hypothetical protein
MRPELEIGKPFHPSLPLSIRDEKDQERKRPDEG